MSRNTASFHDSYFTNNVTMRECIRRALETSSLLRTSSLIHIVDFSAADGRFVTTMREMVLASASSDQFDICPRHEAVQQRDWLDCSLSLERNQDACYILGFNPPFGRAGRIAFEFVELGLQRVQPDVMILILPIRNWRIEGYEVVCRMYLQPNAFYVADTLEPFNVAAELVIWQRTSGSVRLIDEKLPINVKDTGLLEASVTLMIRKVGEYAGRQAYWLNRATDEVYYFSANNIQRIFDHCTLTDDDIRAGLAPWYRENNHIVCSLDPPTTYRGSNPLAGETPSSMRRRQGTGFLKITSRETLTAIAFFTRMQQMAVTITRENLATGNPRSISTAIVARLWCATTTN
jgi:hypothetical protein